MNATVQPLAPVEYEALLRRAGEGATAQAQALSDLVLAGRAGSAEATHAEAGRGREHTLLAAALAYCLGYELRAGGAAIEPELLRLAALAHDLDLPESARDLLPLPVQRWVEDRRLFFDALPGSPFPLTAFNSPAEQALYAAHLIASLPLPVAPNQPAPRAFAAHPLGRGQPLASLALLACSVDAAETYLFEVPRLQEVRGAGALLKRLSRVDVPALFGMPFEDAEDAQRAGEVRAWFAARWGTPPLDAPECLLRADSGTLLALAPAALADTLPAAIEALYVEETLTGQAVVAARRCDLLELQYGLEPARFWRLEYEAAQADADLRLLVADERRFEAPLEPGSFPPRKGFGELVAAVRLLQERRRDERAHYPNWETPVYARRCEACDRRAASAYSPDGAQLCQPCARKSAAGARYGDRAADVASVTAIARASRPAGYVGLILAAVDDVEEHLERLRAPSDYSAFSQQLHAAMDDAVRAALAQIPPTTNGDGTERQPFELLEVGGDRAWLLVPGHRALPVASTLGRTFEAHFPLPAEGDPWAPHRYRPPRGARAGARDVTTPIAVAMTVSAGVVVAPAAASLVLLHDLATQLLTSAKRARPQAAAERSDSHRGGGCDFLVLHGDGLPTTRLSDWRAAQTHRERREAAELRRYAAPYTWPELDGLLIRAADLARAGLSRADRRLLREALARGEAASSVEYLSYRSRATEAIRGALGRFDEAWRGRGGRAEVPAPWRGLPPGPDRRERRETVLADVLELVEFGAPALTGSSDAAR